MNRDDYGSNYESDAAAHEFAHRPEPEPPDIDHDLQDGTTHANDTPRDQLMQTLIAMQREWAEQKWGKR